MGLEELRQRLIEKMRQQNASYEEAQLRNEARDDWETTNKGLRNLRRHVQKYRDEDEKKQLEEYLRQRKAQEDRSWMNPYGMLDNQEVNIARDHSNIFRDQENFFVLKSGIEPSNILNSANPYVAKKNNRR